MTMTEAPFLTESQVWRIAEPIVRAATGAGEAVCGYGLGERTASVLELYADAVELTVPADADLPEYVPGQVERGGIIAEVELRLLAQDGTRAVYAVELVD